MDGATAQILILDDDIRIGRLLKRYLKEERYDITLATTVAEATSFLETSIPDLVILDLMLPDGNGLTLARQIRADHNVGIVILSAKQDVVDRIVGLEIGADDYITKPFDERELLARIRSVLRRTVAAREQASSTVAPEESAPEVVTFDEWRMDLRSHELYAPNGETVHLTSYEFQLLSTFVTRPNRVLSRDEILIAVAGRKWNPFDRSIDVLVGKLRKKLEHDPNRPSLIKTIRGAGYKFTARTVAVAA